MKGFVTYSTYDEIDGQTIIQLFGRLENNQTFAALKKFNHYFYITEKDAKKLDKYLGKYKIEKTELKNFDGENVVKISSSSHRELNKLHHAIHHKTATYEADIKPHMRFLIDHNILGGINIEGEYETSGSQKIDRIYREPEITHAEAKPELKVISLDIETDKTAEKLICIGLYGKNYKKTFFITDKKLENAVSCKNEEECVQKFRDEIIKIDPDIIIGWNLIDFDFLHLQKFFARHKIPFDLGRTNDNVRLRIESNFMRSSSADITGRQVLDGLNLISDPFLQQAPSMRNAQFESYSLEDVAKEILGSGKLIKKRDDIEKIYRENTQKSHQAIADYNLNDCKLVFDILEKTKTIELAADRAQLTGMPLDRVTAPIASFDSLYIREAKKHKLVSPTIKFGNKEERIKGGYVFSEKSGIFSNVLVMDFKSLYPSILCTFNIDPSSHLKKAEKGAVETPNHEYFRNSEGILPEIIKRLHIAREKAKKEKNELASYAIKTTMNSFWGVLASPNCRYFNLNMANAITGFARWIIQTTAKKIEEKGYKVIYSDTDSVFIETNLEKEKANQLGKELQAHINAFYADYVKQNYNRKSYLELQFDKQYISMVIPQLRKKAEEGEVQAAAKKRYAGLVEKDGKEELEITGMEAIRGDWTEAAREFQKELLMKLFHKEPIEKFIKDYIKKIKSGKIDSQLVYRKSIRKSLAEYTKTTPPHVKAARQLDHLDSNIIEYYMTTEGPEPLQKLKHKIDYEHYIEKQIMPIANQVLILMGKDFESISKNSKQQKLF